MILKFKLEKYLMELKKMEQIDKDERSFENQIKNRKKKFR